MYCFLSIVYSCSPFFPFLRTKTVPVELHCKNQEVDDDCFRGEPYPDSSSTSLGTCDTRMYFMVSAAVFNCSDAR